MYDFDKVIECKGTWSMKWDDKPLENTFNNKEVLPLWIAGMDFKAAPAIVEAVQEVFDSLAIFSKNAYTIAEKKGWEVNINNEE